MKVLGGEFVFAILIDVIHHELGIAKSSPDISSHQSPLRG